MASPSPWKKLIHTIDRVLADAAEHVAQVGLGLEPVELGRTDQRIEDRRTLAARVGARKQPVLPADGNRKNALFAGSDGGGANWAIIASLIATCKVNGVNPHTWLADTLTTLVNRWPAARIDDLMPWAYAKIPA